MSYRLIETAAELADLVEQYAHCDAVILDTEFMRRDSFFPVAALVQLCYPDCPHTAWLIDPLAVQDCSALRILLADTSTLKVIHSASEDLEVFQTFLECQPQPLFDTQRAAALAGYGFGLGYRRLVESVSGLALDKDETRSDWLRRPLSESQLEYAAADVVPLLPVYLQLREHLEASNRLAWVLEDGATAAAAAAAPPAPYYPRIKSAWKLDARQLAVLQAVCEWREARARSLDKPRSWILTDALCLALAQRGPRSRSQLSNTPDLPAAVVRKQGDILLQVIGDAHALDAAELPEPLAPPLNGGQREKLKQLKRAAAAVAQEWGVEPEALLPARDYEALVRLGSGEAVAWPEYWRGWRREPLIDPLLKLAAGEG